MPKGFFTLFHDRILLLKQYVLVNLWLQAYGNDYYNTLTILGYRGGDLGIIKQYSDLWKADGSIHFEDI